MKKLLALLCIVLLLFSCKKSNPEIESSETAVFKINSSLTTVNTMFGGTATAMMFQEQDKIGTDVWQYVYDIEGFNFEPGYTYTLIVRKDKLANPPQDASDTKYVLLRVVNKIKVN